MKIIMLPLILMGVILNTAAQLLLKAGMLRIGHFDFELNKLLNISYQVMLNPYIIIGLLAYIISFVVWLMVLSRVEISFAYPLISIGYVLSAITAYYFFNEDLSVLRLLGIVVILFGVYLVARS